MGISDINIPAKIIAGLLAISLVAAGSVIFGARVTHQVSNRAQDLITKDEAAALYLSQANLRVYRSGDIAYRGLSRSDPAVSRELFSRFDGAESEFRARAIKAKDALPSQAAAIDRFIATFADILRTGRRAGELAVAGNREEAAALLEREFDKPLDGMKRDLSDFVNNLAQEIEKSAAAAAESADREIVTNELVVGGSIIAVLAAMIWMVVASISRPLGRLAIRMDGLAKGELDDEIDGTGRGDEVGTMARAVGVFRTNALGLRRLEAEQTASAERIEREKHRAMLDLADRFEASVGGVVSLVASAASELQATATLLTSSAEETSSQSLAVSSASEEASANVQTVAASAEELAGSVHEISRQVEQSAQITARAVDEALHSKDEVSSLAGAVEKIGSIVGLISDIAAQTNLLALNATIEAARAGEAGRGFAVVASEVKGLAEQTAKATADISAHIGAVQTSTRQAADRIHEIGATIQDMNRISSAIAGAVDQQGGATREIARSVQQASQGTNEVSQNIVGVSRAAEESSAAASQVLTSANDLARQSEVLRSEVQTFLATVRTA